MGEQKLDVGDKVRHIKSNGRSKWYRGLINGTVQGVSKSGKTAWVHWFDDKGKYLHSAQYLIGNLVKIQ